MKSRNILFITSLLSSFLLTFFLHNSWTFDVWLDALFLIGLLLLVISAILILIEVEFFVAFIKSFSNFYKRVNKKGEIILESEKRSENIVLYQKKFPSIMVFFQIGILLSFTSLLLSATIYYFGR